MNMNTEKWKKAVVHLECAADSIDYESRHNSMNKLRDEFFSGAITEDDLVRGAYAGSKDIRYQGTAIFLLHNGRRYLITAMHVVRDEVHEKKRLSTLQSLLSEGATMVASYESVFSTIFRVPTLDEVLSRTVDDYQTKANDTLPILNGGHPDGLPFTFSTDELDIAIISLDQRTPKFADQMIERGYVPIEVSDIEAEPACEGEKVFTVGFPYATSLIGELQKHIAEREYSSSYYSLPVFSFGRVCMLNSNLNFFWADISISPGNSGGPVIANDKLVGIVSAQAIEDVQNSRGELQTGIPFGKIIKAKYLLELITRQEEKDRWKWQPSNPQ